MSGPAYDTREHQRAMEEGPQEKGIEFGGPAAGHDAAGAQSGELHSLINSAAPQKKEKKATTRALVVQVQPSGKACTALISRGKSHGVETGQIFTFGKMYKSSKHLAGKVTKTFANRSRVEFKVSASALAGKRSGRLLPPDTSVPIAEQEDYKKSVAQKRKDSQKGEKSEPERKAAPTPEREKTVEKSSVSGARVTRQRGDNLVVEIKGRDGGEGFTFQFQVPAKGWAVHLKKALSARLKRPVQDGSVLDNPDAVLSKALPKARKVIEAWMSDQRQGNRSQR